MFAFFYHNLQVGGKVFMKVFISNIGGKTAKKMFKIFYEREKWLIEIKQKIYVSHNSIYRSK